MQIKINEAAKLTGVTVRTLHYYDQIGLLRPETVTDTGYRLYGEKDLERLSQILFFRELDFSLAQIKDMLDSPSFDRKEALRAQHELLTKKKERLERLIDLTKRRMEGNAEMSFQEFNKEEIERCKEKYAQEAEERWGGTQAYKESKKRTDGYGSAEWEELTQKRKFHHAGFCRLPRPVPGIRGGAGTWRQMAGLYQQQLLRLYR